MTIRRGGSIIAGCASSSVNPDNKSITTNSSDQIQSIGVINQNNTTLAIKTWTGTLAQYNAIATKDNNTLYNITDDTDLSLSILATLYPVGAIYIGTMDTCPLSVLGLGTWVKVSEGRVLQGSDSGHNANTIIEAGLPNITGYIRSDTYGSGGTITSTDGAFYTSDDNNPQNVAVTGLSSANYHYKAHIDASRSSSIYGNSNTVQPPAFIVNIWQRTA